MQDIIHNNQILTSFKQIKDIQDLVKYLNNLQNYEVQKLAQQTNKNLLRKDITEKAILYYAYGNKNRYSTFKIPKRKEGERTIKSPDPFLKKIQHLISITLQNVFTPYPQVTGFVTNRSIVSNASFHTNKKYVYNIDLEDFFTSISFYRVRAVLAKVKPFQLEYDIANIIAALCCDNDCLPQGAPTSPVLSNVVCMRLDARIYTLSKEVGFTYSRYADDITISSNRNIYTEKFKKNLFNIIKEEGFSLNKKKERLQRYNVKEEGKFIKERQQVTGIIVNKKTNVSRSVIRNIQAILFNWSKDGYNETAQSYKHYYLREQGNTRHKLKGKIPSLEMYLNGKIEFIGMVRGKDDALYQQLKLKFDTLCIKKKMSIEDISSILTIWKEEGIEIAMRRFYSISNLK